MRTLLTATIAISLFGMSAAWAGTDMAARVLDRHVAAMKKGDLAGVMADYADDAVVIAPHGIGPGRAAGPLWDVFPGKANASKLFAVLTDRNHVGANRTMRTRYDMRSHGVTLMHWVQNPGTAQQVSGTDIFVIRDGKIAFQDVTINPPAH